jgi:hypothetical protein
MVVRTIWRPSDWAVAPISVVVDSGELATALERPGTAAKKAERVRCRRGRGPESDLPRHAPKPAGRPAGAIRRRRSRPGRREGSVLGSPEPHTPGEGKTRDCPNCMVGGFLVDLGSSALSSSSSRRPGMPLLDPVPGSKTQEADACRLFLSLHTGSAPRRHDQADQHALPLCRQPPTPSQTLQPRLRVRLSAEGAPHFGAHGHPRTGSRVKSWLPHSGR